MSPLPSEKLLQCSFWRFVDTRPIVRPRFRTHFADILNSQLMYAVQLLISCTNDKRRSYPDSLISESMISFADSLFKFLLLPPSPFLDLWRYCIQCVQNGEYSGRTVSFVGIPRHKQHLRPVCGTICKCELYCLSKRSRHFITQQVITFHTFWDLISLHRKNALKYILLYFSKLEFQRMRHTFLVRLQRVFILFRWNLTSMLPDSVAKKRCRGIVIFGLLRE